MLKIGLVKIQLFIFFIIIILSPVKGIYAYNYTQNVAVRAICSFLKEARKDRKNPINLVNKTMLKRSVSVSTIDGKALQVTNDKFAIDEDSGDTSIAGNLEIDGTTTLNGLRISDGSESAPSLSFKDQTNTGLYRLSENNVSITYNNANRAIFDLNGGRLKSNYVTVVHMSSNRTILLGTETVMFNTVYLDPSNSFDTETFTYTTPITGVYFLAVQVGFSALLLGTKTITLLKNNSPLAGYISSNVVGLISRGLCKIIGCIVLEAGDTLRVEFSGAVLLLSADTILAAPSLFSIQLLSV